MNGDRLRAELEARAPGEWELYRKMAESRERLASPSLRSHAWRSEHGWAARWWQAGSPRFASASSPRELEQAIAQAGRTSPGRAVPLEWPSATSPLLQEAKPVEPPPDLFDTLSRSVSAESHGEALLAQLLIRRGFSLEWIGNARGLDISMAAPRLD